MKILCFIDSLGSGGAQRQLVELAKGFKERGHNVSFLVYHHEPFFLHDIQQNEIAYTCISEGNFIKRIFKIRKFIREGNFDAVVSFLEAANFIATLSGFPYRKWRLIVGERSANPKILKSFKLRFYRFFHLFANFVVANSHENIKLVKKINPLISNKKCKVIYNIIDFNFWNKENYNSIESNRKFHLVVAASHQYLKNSKGLIKAVALLNSTLRHQLKIDWYGDERSDDSLNEAKILIEKLELQNTITFFPATTEIKSKMQQADAIGLFSFHEGLPNVICEAMSIGKPIISSAVSDIPILLNNNPKLIFNPYDENEISSTLSYLMSLSSDQLNKIGEENMNNATRFFAKEQIVSEYLNLMN